MVPPFVLSFADHSRPAPTWGAPMRSAARLRCVAVLFALLVVFASFAIQAQSTGPKPITPDDCPKFKRITNAAISTDGKWMLYTSTPNEGDGTLVVRALDGDRTYDVPRGASAAFSDDAPAPSGGATTGAPAAPPRTLTIGRISRLRRRAGPRR